MRWWKITAVLLAALALSGCVKSRSSLTRQERERLAEELIERGQYDSVLTQYSDLPAAWDARESKALKAGITYCARVEIRSLDSATVTISVVADPAIRPESGDMALFMTSASVRVGQWSERMGKDIEGWVRFFVGGEILSLEPYQCRTAAKMGRDNPENAMDFVLETAQHTHTRF